MSFEYLKRLELSGNALDAARDGLATDPFAGAAFGADADRATWRYGGVTGWRRHGV